MYEVWFVCDFVSLMLYTRSGVVRLKNDKWQWQSKWTASFFNQFVNSMHVVQMCMNMHKCCLFRTWPNKRLAGGNLHCKSLLCNCDERLVKQRLENWSERDLWRHKNPPKDTNTVWHQSHSPWQRMAAAQWRWSIQNPCDRCVSVCQNWFIVVLAYISVCLEPTKKLCCLQAKVELESLQWWSFWRSRGQMLTRQCQI